MTNARSVCAQGPYIGDKTVREIIGVPRVSVEMGDTGIVIPLPFVAHPTYVRFVQDGKEVGRVEARFDFTHCPLELHHLAMQSIQSGSIDIRMPPPGGWNVPEPKPEAPKRSWWRLT